MTTDTPRHLRADAPAPALPRRPSRRWMALFGLAVAAAAVGGTALAALGVATLRDSRVGRPVADADPSDPGFEAVLEPTPTLLVLQEHEGALSSAALVSLRAGDAGGTVVLMPPGLMVGDGNNDVLTGRLEVAHDFGVPPDTTRGSVEYTIGVGIDEVVVVDDERWAALVEPVAPIVVTNPDPVDPFPAGEISLAPADLAAWLSVTAEGENDLARLYRQALLWEAWIAQVAESSDQAAVPGEVDSGLGRFVRALAAGRFEVTMVPVTESIDAVTGLSEFHVIAEPLDAILSEAVPFPRGTELAPRTLVRLLDGTGTPSLVQRLVPEVVGARASVVVVGNADTFDYTTTEVRYHHPDQREAAERLREALGAGDVVEDVRPIDSFDVTIVLGDDAVPPDNGAPP